MVIFTVRKLHANSPVNRQIQQQTCLHTTEKVRNPAGKCLLFNPLWLFKFVKRATCHMCWVYAFLFLAVRLCCLTRAHLQHMFSNWWRCFLNMLFFFFFSCCLKWRWVELSSPPCKLPFSILITRAHKQNMKSWKQSTESSVWNECDLQLQRSNVQRQRHRKQRLLSESSAISLACLQNMFPRFCVDVKLLCLLSGWY